MDVLVTGGSGAIGRFVSRELNDRGHELTTFDLESTGGEAGQHLQGDVTDSAAVTDAVSSVDVVVHLAAVLGVKCSQDPALANAVNVGGTLNVFDAAVEHGVRVLFASSKSVFGPISGRHAHPEYEPISEDAPRNPDSVYGITKLASENYAAIYRESGLDATALRFGLTYGPGKGTGYVYAGFIDEMIRQAHSGERVHVSGAEQCIDATYYPDIASGVADILESPAATQPTYHIGSGDAWPLSDFVDALREQTDASIEMEGGLRPAGVEFPKYCQLDITRVESDAGYEPEYGPAAAVRDYLTHLD